MGTCVKSPLQTPLTLPVGMTLKAALKAVATAADSLMWAAVDTGESCDLGILYLGDPQGTVCGGAIGSVKAVDIAR